MDKTYQSKKFEDKIYKNWIKKDLFNPDKYTGEPYSIMMPPPNVTGVLHLGHALENSLMDSMARYQRLQGKKVLLLPGVDHAAVATQAKVEKILIEQGMENPRQELGRDKLLEKVKKYADESRDTILKQIRRMGTSCDWSRFAYTFDKERNQAVNKVFKKMYDDGLIYRGYKVINWSVKGQSTCSDDELEHKEREAKLYTFKYSKDFPIEIATTRPETKLGDTAVAVNPKDKRYKKYIGQELEVDFCGNKLKLKIISDPEVDPDFGTGALGVTPAHSPVDFEMYEKQKALKQPIGLIPVIGADGKMTKMAGAEFVGLSVEKARDKVVKKLKANGLFIKEEDIMQNVGTSDRFGDVVEAIPMTQWFVDVNKEIPGKKKSLKQLMTQAVNKGHKGKGDQKINIAPQHFEKIYFQWIDNLRDWCISRQIWFGHRIPVWYKEGNSVVGIRHGEAENNAQDYLNGDIDNNHFALTKKGQKQVEQAAEELADQKFDLIYTSDFLRTKQTAKILADKLGVKQVIEDPRLREYGMGEFEGNADGSLSRCRCGHFADWKNANPHGVESWTSVYGRTMAVLEEIKQKHTDKKVLIVSHGEILRYISSYGRNLEPEQTFLLPYPQNAGTIKVDLNEEQIKVSDQPVNDPGWHQDPDTLDTWFSSGLWTFSTLGWPENNKEKNKEKKKIINDLKTFHPTSWMQMGYELLFFWMARMILMSTYVMDEIPFKNVYIHGMLRDEKGQKFSKSAGNGVDPIEVIDKYGADALRWALLIGISPGNDSAFYDEKVESARNLVNKLWNVSRYIIGDIGDKGDRGENKETLADAWILSRFNQLKERVTKLLDEFNFSAAGEELREFTWSEFADWYIEISKIKDQNSELRKKILVKILKELLVMWHPYVPFVTQAIWQQFDPKEDIMITQWPKVDKALINKPKEQKFAIIKEVIIKIRNLRSEYKIDPGKRIKVLLKTDKPFVEENKDVIIVLARLEQLDFVDHKPEKAASAVVDGVEVYLPLADILDPEKEKQRLVSEKSNLETFVGNLEKKLSNKQFISNAPKQVVEIEKQKLKTAQENLSKIQQQIINLN
ncbi:class I tRNA ligase family protein [Candidatus Falkowbacteria bacterium]|jgi:valyl-tRNA synthetase|nr:class I tRNA ligase family protein [Candidatus Falkowbacteria bacterium]MBT5503017.1 class I tRNA ligase family protein [Candidatus Falkowbacteria bacterium]MBT7349034.1 class I tRNA ligase family protein [Candidatus Falkowbacteria bacterium]MBT7500972.1 class I tRNA ligase family protein [Candidatus Falkowbacteria bacterium]